MNKGLVSVFALVVAFLSGCGIPGSEDSVHIVIPEEYRGVFKITADGRGDEVFKENGSYRFGIPETGILGVRDTAPLRTFQEMKVTFESGENLPEGMFENEHRLAYYYLWSDAEGSFWFLIGNRDDYTDAQNAHEIRVGEDFVVE